MYLRRLFAACSGRTPTARDDGFNLLLSRTWEYATGKPDVEGWERHFRAADRDLMLLDTSEDPRISLSGDGPGTPVTFLAAYIDAGDLAENFQKTVERRREKLRQLQFLRRLA